VILLASGLSVGLPPAVIWHRAELATSQATATAADQARGKAIEAQQAAERLAATQELFALESTIRRRSVDRPSGWTWENRADLVEAAARSTAEGRSPIDLRSDAAATLLSPDLRAVEPWNTGLFTAAVAATSPDGSVVALGEFKAWGLPTLPGLAPATGTVLLVDPKTGQPVRKLAFPVAPVRNGDGNPVQDGARAMAFSADGKRLFVGTRASKVIRFDLDARNGKRTGWDARAGEFRQLGVSPDGTTLYGVCDGEKSLLRWDAQSGKKLPGFASPHGVLAFAVEPQTGDVIVSDGPTLYRLDPATMQPRSSASVERGHVKHLAFAGEGRVLVAGHGDQLDLCDPAGVRFTNRFADPGLRRSAHEDSVGAIAVHPSGGFVATAARGDVERRAKVWAVASGQLVGSAAVPGTGPIALAWCDGGRVLLATASGRVLRFEFSPGAPQEFTAFSPDPLGAVALAPDARGVAALADPAPDGTVALLRADRGAVTATSLSPWAVANIPGLVVTPGGTVLATRTGTGVTAWRPGTPPRDTGFTDRLVRYPRLSPDGEVLWAVVDSSSILAWDADRRTSRGAWSNAAAEFLSGLSSLDALAAGRRRAVVGGRDGTVHVFDDHVKQVAQFLRPGDPVLAVGLAADESLAVAGTRSGLVRVLRLADGAELPAFVAHPGGVTAVGLSREGLLVTGGKDRAVRVWRRSGERFEPVLSIDRLTAPVQSLEFAASDNRLLVLLANEHAARLWNLDLLRAECAALGLGW
jgi:WD40 repeat protein